jgi:hypothetical protein
MNRLLIVVSLVSFTVPLCAQGQQQNVAKLKAEARNAVSIIGSDKDKTQIYCQIVDLGRADQEKDRKKDRAIAQKMPDGQEIASIIRSLNQSCPD